MATLDDDQRQAILNSLPLEDDTNIGHLFRTAEAMPVSDVSKAERDQVKAFLKNGDLMMVRLALAHHVAKEAGNTEQAAELLQTLTGMWTDLCLILATPTLECVHKTDLHDSMPQIKKLLERLKYTKSHLSHGADEPTQPKSKRPKTDVKVPTSNRFEALSEPEPSTSQAPDAAADGEMDTTSDPAPPPKRDHVDPIFILITGDWAAYIRHLNKNVLSTPIKAKTSGEYMKVTPATPEDYRKLIRHLVETKMSFHALMPKAERPVKILIRGLPNTIQPPAIATELVEKGYTPIYVTQLRKRGPEKDPLPLYLVTLKALPGWEKIYEEDTLMETAVYIKSFRSTGSKQCYRCQAFGHSSQNCYMPPKCMKCGGGHESRECIKPRSEKATCVNCGGAHTSSYSGCPVNPKNLPGRGEKTREYMFVSGLSQLPQKRPSPDTSGCTTS